MAGFFNCGFACVAARKSVFDEKAKIIRDKSTRLQKFLSTFADSKDAFAVSKNVFDKRLPMLLKTFDKWRGADKSKSVEHFSCTSWKSLSAAKRGLHSVSNCKACTVNHLLAQSLFPVRC